MAELKFASSLNQDQSNYAIDIVKKAEELGVSPVLALGIAMKESSLNPGAPDSSAGAIGGMQVMPFNAKPFGYTAEQLRDPKINIEVGLKLLKENLERTNNNWPMAAALYNAGDKRLDNANVAKNGLPDETKAYLKQLKQWGVFSTEPSDEAQPAAEAESAAEAKSADAESTEPDEKLAQSPDYAGLEQKMAERKAATANDAQIIKDAQERFGAQVVGAGTGAAITTKRAAPTAIKASAKLIEEGKILAQEAKAAREAAQLAQAAQAAGTSGAAGRGPLSAIPFGGPDGGRLAPGSTGNMPFNYAKAAGLTDIEAGQALDMTKNAGGVHDLSSQRRAALGRINDIAPNQFVENPRFGGLMTPTGGGGGGPRESFKMAPEVAPSPELPTGQAAGLRPIPVAAPISTAPPKPGGLEYVQDLFKGMMDSRLARGAGTVMRYAGPPLALAGAAGEGMNINQEMNKPSEERNYGDMALSGLGAIAGLASLAPAATVAIPAGLTAAGIGAYRYLQDRAAADRANKRMAGQPMR